jgi:hypothetical protein
MVGDYTGKPNDIKSKIAPHSENKRTFIIHDYNRFHNKFRIGVIFIPLHKKENMQLKFKEFWKVSIQLHKKGWKLKDKQFWKKVNIVWSNYV